VKRFSKYEARVLSAVVSLCILVGSIPVNSQIVIASQPKEPTITINICQPLQPALSVSPFPIARLATSPPTVALLEREQLPADVTEPLIDLCIAPESPPPKASA
jgi:hypothetical protein